MNSEAFFLETDRLRLRPHRLEDAPFMVELNSNPKVMRFVPDGPLASARGAEEIIGRLRQQFVERQIGRFIVLEKRSGQKLGWCGLKYLEESSEVDLGYRFLESAWGQGYATEASLACLDYGFRILKFPRIIARVQSANSGSLAVVRKLKMRESGKTIDEGEEYLVFELLADEFCS